MHQHPLAPTLEDLAKKTACFPLLRPLLPLIPETRRAEQTNRDIAELLKTLQDVVPKLRSSCNLTTRSGESVGGVMERMSAQLAVEVGKTNEEMKDIRGKMEQVETGRQKQLKEESSQLIKDIDALLADNATKINSLIQRKRTECLGTSNTAIHPTPHFTSTLTQRLKTTSIASNLHNCHQILGEIRIHQQLIKPSPLNDPQRREQFINSTSQHLRRQFNCVSSSLAKLNQPSSSYEAKLQQHCQEWGRRVRVALESAILGVSGASRAGPVNNSEVLAAWGDMCEELRNQVG